MAPAPLQAAISVNEILAVERLHGAAHAESVPSPTQAAIDFLLT